MPTVPIPRTFGGTIFVTTGIVAPTRGGILSDAELASIRADAAAAACDQPCVIQRKTTTHGSSGETLGTWVAVVSCLAGMTQPGAGLLANYAYLVGSLATWHVRFPSGTNVQHQDRLIIGADTLEVQVLLTPQSYSALDSVLATEIR